MLQPARADWRSVMLFILLCLIWGSSFILMKLGMFGKEGDAHFLTPWQLASLRLLSASAVMVPVALRHGRAWLADRNNWLIAATGFIGTFLPAILFCVAETGISSALAGTLNAVTPLFTLLLGYWLFRRKPLPMQQRGIFVGLAGCILLFAIRGITPPQHIGLALLVIGATICYGLNTNIAREKLAYLPSLRLSAFALAVLFIPSLLMAGITGLFRVPANSAAWIPAIASGILLGLLGTAVATVLFYALVKRAGAVMASMVTYGIPVVAIGWGLVYGEQVSSWQLVALAVILGGVFMASSSGIKKASAKAGRS